MFGRTAITLGIGPHIGCCCWFVWYLCVLCAIGNLLWRRSSFFGGQSTLYFRPHHSTSQMRPIAIQKNWRGLSVCWSGDLLLTTVSPSKTAEPIVMPFGILTRLGPKKHALDGVPDSPCEEAILRGMTSVFPGMMSTSVPGGRRRSSRVSHLIFPMKNPPAMRLLVKIL